MRRRIDNWLSHGRCLKLASFLNAVAQVIGHEVSTSFSDIMSEDNANRHF